MCKIIFWIFLTLYLIAVSLFIIGQFGLLNSPSGPLSGVFLVPLGLPWNLAIDYAPKPTWPWLGVAAPLVNLIILRMACRIFRAA